MKEDIQKIITMVEEGKLTSEEASGLIEALKAEEPETTQSRSYLGKMFKIRISNGEKEKVRLSVPIRMVKWLLKTGHGIASAIPDAKPYVEDIDMDLIMQAIDNEIEGKIIDLDTEEGDVIAIYIE